MDLTKYIRDIPDFPKPGIIFKDITPLLADTAAFRHSVQLMCEYYQNKAIDGIAAAEARGFLFAAPMSYLLEKPLIPLRKPGKLPYRTYSLKYQLEYGSAELHMHEDVVHTGANILLVDDLLATGGTMEAGCQLIEKAGGKVAGCAFLVELSFLKGRDRLIGHDIFSLLQYD